MPFIGVEVLSYDRDNRHRRNGVLWRRCKPMLMEGWYFRMIETVEACFSSRAQSEGWLEPCWQLQRVGQIRPWVCANLCFQERSSKRDQISNYKVRGLESRLCHNKLTSSENRVRHRCWGTCPCYMPQWLGETWAYIFWNLATLHVYVVQIYWYVPC